MTEQLKDLDNLKPIDHAVVAKPHTPVYKMHRYFARRPWSVFAELIEHYSNPGSIILDPFCGGGVTVVEGLRLGRKVIGVDLNPLATFITRMEILHVDPAQMQKVLADIEAACREEVESLYLTTCPGCGKGVPADWFEWSNVVKCRECGREVALSAAARVGKGEKIAGVSAGKFRCPHDGCSAEWRPAECARVDDQLIKVHVTCPHCKRKGEFDPGKADIALARRIADGFDDRVTSAGLWYPRVAMPEWWDLRRPYNAHIKSFAQLFTKRNLLASAIIATRIRNAELSGEIKELLTFVFSASLRFSNRMVCRVAGWQGGKPIEWAGATYWLPETHVELNAWSAWRNRARAVLSGKRSSQKEIGDKSRPAASMDDLRHCATALVLTGDSRKLPVPASSIDVIITDPPYGNNVLYSELANFYWVWESGILGKCGLIDDAGEVIMSKEHNKDLGAYRDLLLGVFRECHRVLKPGRWMVMTFHNREFKVWSAIHLAAHDAGFVLAETDGMLYQPPIRQYVNTIQTRRSGSMLGDFILSFQKSRKPPEFKVIPYAEVGAQIERFAAEAILHHNGASLSTIYLRLMPWLLNNNLLEKMSEDEVVPYLQRNFQEREGKWHLRKNHEPALHEYLRHYSKTHYKAELEELNIVPVEARLDFLIRRLLYERGSATQDEILTEIYTNLINSNAADYGEIQRVLTRLAVLQTPRKRARGAAAGPARKVWRLKEILEQEALIKGMYAGEEQERATREESDHDLAISRLVDIAGLRSLRAHIGLTEQHKYTLFRRLSSDLPQRVAGMPKAAREIVEQIDVLWHNGGRGLVAAFEVERTTTITSGIERFRNLLAAASDVAVELYLVVPRSREKELRATLGSPANRKDGLHRRIGFIFLEDLRITAKDATKVRFEEIVHHLPENGS